MQSTSKTALNLPLVPVTELIDLGRVLMSITCGVCTHGTLKCVPSPTLSGSIPRKRSKMMTLSPPSTAPKQASPGQLPLRQPAVWHGLCFATTAVQSTVTRQKPGSGVPALRTVEQRRLQHAGGDAQAHRVAHRPVEHVDERGRLLRRHAARLPRRVVCAPRPCPPASLPAP